MRILIDGDACPRVKKIEEIAQKYSVNLILYCDIYHNINLDYGRVKVVDSGFQSVDMYIINECKEEDIIITQDYGVAAIALNKKCFCINPNGFIYNNDNINKLLFERHLKSKIRQSGGRIKGPKKRSEKDDVALEKSLIGLLELEKDKELKNPR